MAKHREIEALGNALKISKDFEGGAAFDFELQERKREQKLAEKDQRRKEKKRERKEAKKREERLKLEQHLRMV